MALFGETGYALVKPFGRAIATLIPDVVVEEAHQDRMVVTQHPVEGGGLISDHAYKLNPIVEIRAGWSDSSAGEAGYSRETYDALRRLQDAKRLISVYTGKRAYRNMIPVGLSVVTDQRTENSLMAVLVLEQLTLTRIQTTSVGADGDQADPSSTGSLADNGAQSGSETSQQDLANELSPDSDPSTGTQDDLGNGLGGPEDAGTIQPDAGDLPGLAQPDTIDLPSIEAPPSVDYTPLPDQDGVGGLQGSSPDFYDMFGGGP